MAASPHHSPAPVATDERRPADLTGRVERFMGVAATRSNSDAYLDGVRAVAVLAVIGLHARAAVQAPEAADVFGVNLEFVFRSLYMGVDLFFVLSGFLLARPWFQAEHTGRRRPALGTFWKRRFARIAPGYYFSLIVTVFLFAGATIPLDTITGRLGVQTIGSHLLFIQNYVPVASNGLNYTNVGWWTLTVEMTWYLVLPAFALAFVGRRWAIALPVIAALSIAWILLARSGVDWLVAAIVRTTDEHDLRTVGVTAPVGEFVRSDILLPSFPSFALTFALGVGLAKLWSIARNRPAAGWQHPSIATAAFVVGLVALTWTAAWTFAHHVDPHFARFAFGILLALVVYGIAFGHPLLRRPLEWLPLRYIGWVSFGVYLFNLPVLAVVHAKLDVSAYGPRTQVAIYFVATLLGSIAAATFSWLAVERPFLAKRTAPADRSLRQRIGYPPRVVVAVGLVVVAVASYGWVVLHG